ncbi:MAG TPA: hypothetical protein VIV12_19370 [Streptosporangiaceae bacterium]
MPPGRSRARGPVTAARSRSWRTASDGVSPVNRQRIPAGPRRHPAWPSRPPTAVMTWLPARARAASAAKNLSCHGRAGRSNAQHLSGRCHWKNSSGSSLIHGVSASSWMAAASADLPLLDGPFSTTTRPPPTLATYVT